MSSTEIIGRKSGRREAVPAAVIARWWRECKERGSMTARTRLIEHYRPLVPLSRERAVPRVPDRIAVEDLHAEGYLGLVRAVDRYEPARRVKFESFAITYIRGAMRDWLRREDWAPRSLRERGEATLEVVSLDELLGADPEEEADLQRGDRIEDPAPGPEAEVITMIEAGAYLTLISRLPSRERHLLIRYYWDDWSPTQIARELGVSSSRVHQLHQQGVERLQRRLGLPLAGPKLRPAVSGTTIERTLTLLSWGYCTAPELAREMGLTLDAMQHRLLNMLRLGYVTRSERIGTEPFRYAACGGEHA